MAYSTVFSVPLKIVVMNKTANGPEYKIGVFASIFSGLYELEPTLPIPGLPNGVLGIAPKLYEFDTGGSGYWSAYFNKPIGGNPWWPKISNTTSTYQIQYSSGNTYSANGVPSKVFLPAITSAPNSNGQPGFGVLSTSEMMVAQIITASGGKIENWQNTVDQLGTPLDNNFIGDFGAALNAVAPTTGSGNLTSVLANFPTDSASITNLLNAWGLNTIPASSVNYGFMVDLGAFPSSQPAPDGQLGLYINGTVDDTWTAVDIININTGANASTDPKYCFQGTLTLSHSQLTTITFSNLNILLDSGAPSTNLKYGTSTGAASEGVLNLANLGPYNSGTAQNPALLTGTTLTLSVTDGSKTFQIFTFTYDEANAVPCKSDAALTAAPANSPENINGTGYINTGLQGYFGNQVIFMLPDGSPAGGQVLFCKTPD